MEDLVLETKTNVVIVVLNIILGIVPPASHNFLSFHIESSPKAVEA